ncbi:hypothetical protein [Nocardiopsis halotolerans]|uniref:hypothetical protein n=1 Tax=Nocardiopsis halotolerans TaxID=124252 RepID=UPI000347E63A|nr:hypothetical protein [Nocardiopsis halotolerans]
MSGNGRFPEITIKDRVEPALGLLVVLAAPWLLTVAGTGEVTVRDPVTWHETQAYAWAAPLTLVVTALGCPLLLTISLFLRGPAVCLDAERIQLRGKSKVFARWSEVDRIVLWRRRVRRFGFIPGWEPQVGIVPAASRTEGFRQVASVRLSYRCGSELASGVARFAPDTPVVDERSLGQAPPTEPR